MHSSNASSPTSILLIEPQGGLAKQLQDTLLSRTSSVDIGLAGSLREAMNHLCTHRVDLTLMDLTLPDYKGLDAIRALRLTAPNCALVAMGKAPDDTLVLEALRAGAHEVLSTSSLSPDALWMAIARAMARTEQWGEPRASTSMPSQLSFPPPPSRIVHDLNNLMTSVNGYADILLARLTPDDPARSHAEQVKKAGMRAAALVKTLASLSDAQPAVSAPPHNIGAPAV